MVDHRIEDQSGMLVAIVLNTADYLAHIVRTKMGIESCLASNALQKLLLSIFAAETETNQIGCRQGTSTLRRERTFAVERIIGIDSSPLLVGCHRDTTTHVTDNQIQVFILLTNLRGITTSDGALVQGMPDADAVHQGRTRDTGIVIEFIDDTWIGDKRATMGYRRRYLVSNETAQIAGMVMESNTAMGILNHQVVDLVNTTFEGFHQSTTPYNCIELHRDASLLKFVEHQLATEILLLNHIVELCQFLWCMHDIADKHRRLVFEDCHLGGSGAWIDH